MTRKRKTATRRKTKPRGRATRKKPSTRDHARKVINKIDNAADWAWNHSVPGRITNRFF